MLSFREHVWSTKYAAGIAFNFKNTKNSNNNDDYNNNGSNSNNYKKDMFTAHTKCNLVRDMEIQNHFESI